MKKSVAVLLMTVLGLGLLIYTASRTVSLVQLTLPADKQVLGYVALVAFDGGLVIWTLLYLYGARGGWQRAIALLMILVSLLGIVVAFLTDTFIQAGRNGIVGRADSTMVSTAIWIIAAIIGINVAAVTFFHLMEPDRLRGQAEEEARSQIETAALRQIRESADSLAAQLAPYIAADWVQQMTTRYLSSLGNTPQLPPPPSDRSAQLSPTPAKIELIRPAEQVAEALRPLSQGAEDLKGTNNSAGGQPNPDFLAAAARTITANLAHQPKKPSRQDPSNPS